MKPTFESDFGSSRGEIPKMFSFFNYLIDVRLTSNFSIVANIILPHFVKYPFFNHMHYVLRIVQPNCPSFKSEKLLATAFW